MANKNFRVKHGLEVAGSASIENDLTVTGNLTVNGTTTTLNTETLAVEDNIVVLNSNVTGTPSTNAGIEVERGDSTNSGLTWNESDDKWYQDRAGSSTVIPVSTSELVEGTNLYYTDGRFDTRLATKTTSDLTEGTNLYYTDARARAAISVTDAGGDGSLAYDNGTGVITYTGPSATEVRAHFSGGTGVTITDGVVAIGQSVGTGNSPTFAGVSAGNISVGVATDNTITSTNTNGNLVLAANGTGDIVLSTQTRLQGEMQASTNLNYTFPPQTLNTITDNNGYSAASSMPAGTNGYGANAAYTHYYGDTLAGVNTTAAVQLRTANGNSVTGDTVPFTGIASVAPSAVASGAVMGTFNFNGYGTTGFSNDIGTQYQGGGINAMHGLQFQSFAAENFSDSTLTLNSTNVTAVASSFRAALGSPQVTGTKGQISFNTTTPGVGNAVRVTGTLTGTATGIVSGQTYYIIVTNGSTTAQLSATPGGSPIDTTAGTLTGLTLTRCGVTFTTTGLTSVPFGRGALVTVSGVTNVADGTYPVFGTPTTTSFGLGIPHTVAPTVAGSQSFSCTTGYMASGYRVRAFPLATPANFQNRMELVNHTAASFAVRADAVSFNKGSYGTSGGLLPGGDISYRRTYGCFHKMANVTAAAADTVYAFDWTADTTAHVNTQGVTVSNTSRINFDNAGDYNVVIEMVGKNTDSQDRTAFIWLAKNGTDLAETAIKLVLSKETTTMLAKDWLVNGIVDNDYIEVRFACDTTVSGISLEYSAAQTSPYVRPAVASATITITPVGA